MIQFSIVIPFFGDPKSFEETLASVLRYLPDGSRVVIPHDGSYADPHQLAGAVEFVAVQSGKWADMWSLILKQLNSTFVCTFWPGVEISEGWDQEIVDLMVDPQIGSVSPRMEYLGQRTFAPREVLGVGVDQFGTRRLIQFEAETTRVLGPTSYAAAYRVEALSWLPVSEEAVEDDYLDADLGLGLSVVGYRTVVSNWTVTCRIPNIFKPRAHGCSASRSLIRYRSQFQPSGSPLIADLWAVLKGQGWRARHGMGRFEARKSYSADRAFRREVESNREAVASLFNRRAVSAPLRRAG
jgi:hypothetical protein